MLNKTKLDGTQFQCWNQYFYAGGALSECRQWTFTELGSDLGIVFHINRENGGQIYVEYKAIYSTLTSNRAIYSVGQKCEK